MAAIRVAIAIVVSDGRVLIARRPTTAALGGYWEYPGGKCEGDEDPRECVVREVREETGLNVRPIQMLKPIDWHYPDGAVRLYPFVCAVVSGEARAIWADEARWVSSAELDGFLFPPANAALKEEVIDWLSRRGADVEPADREPRCDGREVTGEAV